MFIYYFVYLSSSYEDGCTYYKEGHNFYIPKKYRISSTFEDRKAEQPHKPA